MQAAASTVPEPLSSSTTAAARPAGKSIQAYIDEQPVWADGTAVDMTPMTVIQWRILILAAAGELFEGFVVFMTGVALPLIADAVQHRRDLQPRSSSSAIDVASAS